MIKIPVTYNEYTTCVFRLLFCYTQKINNLYTNNYITRQQNITKYHIQTQTNTCLTVAKLMKPVK